MRLLIAEDEDRAGAYLYRGLIESGHVVDRVADGETALNLAMDFAFDAIVLGRRLAVLDGVEVVRRLRGAGCPTPVLMLGTGASTADRVLGLGAGADDYLVKPYAFSELLARLEALTRFGDRRARGQLLQVGDLELNLATRSASRAGRVLKLRGREFSILQVLMQNAGRIVTRTTLLEAVWDLGFDPLSTIVDMHMHRLRQKVDDGFDPPLIHTEPGAGYRLGPKGG
ncbi:MAG: DNA-binding response regulator [Caulobacteraceae bacterium]|nr:DNA-binding response regulator [Caulobacteraceae bacterium]